MSARPLEIHAQRRRVGLGRFGLVFLLLVALLAPSLAQASKPVIVPGREAQITALFVPYELGDELAAGWVFHSFDIEVGTIHVWIAGPEHEHPRRYAELTLDHPDYAPPDSRSLTGFALHIVDQPEGSETAVQVLSAAVESNDNGLFWLIEPEFADELGASFGGDKTTIALNFLRDGFVFLAALSLGLVVFATHKLQGAPKWAKWVLLGAVLGGAALRLLLSPAVALAPWSYTRFLLSARIFYGGPILEMFAEDPIWASETIVDSTLAFSMLAPLAVFVHARYLLDDHRAALAAAVLVAVLPLHLRFSHSDAAFIPSITVSSVAFALIHAATREQSRAWAWAALVLLPYPVAVMFEVRPLNIMYFPLLLATALVSQGLHRDKPKADRLRVVIAGLVVCAITFGLGVPWLLAGFEDQVSEGLSLKTLSSAVSVVLSPRMNALLNPIFTPPGLTLLAGLGAVDLWTRGRRRLLAFVGLWLLGFLVAHAYVIPNSPYMQARYHLHLVVPYMLLVVCGFDAVLRWIEVQRSSGPIGGRGWLGSHLQRGPHRGQIAGVALIAYVLASPLIHLYGIRNTEFNDTREWLFVHSLREQIPAGCTVIEYGGHNAGSRMTRVGAYMLEGDPLQRWEVVVFSATSSSTALSEPIRALLEDPPECLYWYSGLTCWSDGPDGDGRRAGACEAIEGYLPMREVASSTFESVSYDENLSQGLTEGQKIELGLYRLETP